MAVTKITYAASTAITCSIASLASSATVGRESTAVDNTTNLYIDALVQVKAKLQTGTPANDKRIYVYAYGSEDGATYTDNATGTDAAITLTDPPNARLIGVIEAPSAGALAWESQPMSVAAAFGGYLPRKWGIIIRNFTGVALDASEATHSKSYTGVYFTTA